ncbi:MAG: hypothetical protein IAG10_24255 [Planctomycetaceae bacterium]|nr:hypothetical protein [Planctomycetaceae bacterium]
MNELKKQPYRSAGVIAAYLKTCAMFALPYLLLAGLGPSIFFRNWLRTLSGPAVELVARLEFGSNALLPHLVIVVVLLPIWLAVICATRLRDLPVAVHIGLATLWCGYGFVQTLAI